MFQQKCGKWIWYFENRESEFELPEDPSSLLAGADIIKDTPMTLVFRKGGLFFKWEKKAAGGIRGYFKNRYFSRAGREYRTLCNLRRNGFYVTPPVGFAVSQEGCILVTGEVAGAVSVAEYIADCYGKNEPLCRDFLVSWGEFWGTFVQSGYYSPDFHCGNVLYVEREKRFALVDLYGVRKPFRIRHKQQARMIFRQLKDAMEFLSEAELIQVLKSAGVIGNNEQYAEFLDFYAGEAQALLLRRLRCFDECNIRRRPFCREWNFAETAYLELPEEVIAEAWMKDFACQLHGIPHLHLLERNGTKLKMEKFCGEISAEEAEPLKKRVEAAGYDPASFGYCRNAGGRYAVCDGNIIASLRS